MDIDRKIAFLNQTEGRDKFCKMIQYASRFLKFQFEGQNEALFNSFNGLFQNMSVARKLFRLFKSFNEYVKIKGILKEDMQALDRTLALLARLGFLFYWIFDNLAVLIKVKFFQSMDLKQMSRRAAKCWLFGIVMSIICAIRAMIKTAERQSKLMIERARAKSEVFDQQKWDEDMKKCQAQQKVNTLNVIKNLGDSITASQALGYPSRFLNVNFNDGMVGVGGFTSAAITCYQLYPAAKK